MYFFALLSLLSSICSFLFGGFIFLKSPRNVLNRLFFSICWVASILSFAEFELRMSESLERAAFWSKLSSFGAIITALIFHFILVFGRKKKISWSVASLIYIPALCIFFIDLFTQLITIDPVKVYWGWSMQFSESIVAYLAGYWYLLILCTTTLYSVYYYRKLIGQRKKQARLISIALFFSLGSTIVTDLIFPAFFIQMPELGNTFTLIALIIIGYGIWKYQLFEIKPESIAGKIIATISDGLLFINSKSQIIEVNQAGLQMLGYNKDELLGKQADSIFDSSSLIKFSNQQIWEKLNHGNIVNDVEISIISKSGQQIPMSLSASRIEYENNINQGIIYLVRDISERKVTMEILKKNEKQLRKSNATKDKFFSIIAHDLKNPFHAILSSSRLLKEGFDEMDTQENKELISYINQSSEVVFELLQNLLSWSRSQQGIIHYKPSTVNLNSFVSENIKTFNDMANQKRITVTTNINPDIFVHTDIDMASTILRNLISNAIKFSPENENIKISAKLAGHKQNRAEIVVQDYGIGMDKAFYKNLFNIDRKTSANKTETGTGLGLILCKEFIDKMDGKIWVESEPGKGSKFYFTLTAN